MKTFKLVGMTWMAILMCVNFTSCTEDEPQYELIHEGKKIVKVEIEDPYTSTVSQFKYNKKGQLTEIVREGEYDNVTFNYAWGSNKIGPYHLKDGLISNDYNTEVTYNSNKRPIEVGGNSDYSSYTSYTWGADRLLRMSPYHWKQNGAQVLYMLHFEYGEPLTCNGYNPIIHILLSRELFDDYLCVAHPELMNARTTILPHSFKKDDYYTNDSGRLDYDTYKGYILYRFDDDGYIVECIMRENTLYDVLETKYIITWE